jgi:hypothetical protein
VSANIGRGTRLLCVKRMEDVAGVNVQVGLTYTCMSVDTDLCDDPCNLTPGCYAAGVELEEIGIQIVPYHFGSTIRMYYCLCQFVPLQGSLPVELIRLLDVPSDNANKKVKESA